MRVVRNADHTRNSAHSERCPKQPVDTTSSIQGKASGVWNWIEHSDS